MDRRFGGVKVGRRGMGRRLHPLRTREGNDGQEYQRNNTRTIRWNVGEIDQARVVRGYLQRRIVLEVPSAPNKRSCQGNTPLTLTPDWSLGDDIHYRIARN
jgi:hypothetical protein